MEEARAASSYTGKYRTSCDICHRSIGQRVKVKGKVKRIRIWSYVAGSKKKKMIARCQFHLRSK